MSKEKILVVDDDADIQNILKHYIENENFCYYSAGCLDEALDIIDSTFIDLIVLDVMLPGKDGFDCCLEIRKKTSAPIIFLSCKGEEINKIIGLSVGGDDYITKPFLPGEFVARIKSNIRRSRDYSSQSPNSHILAHNNLTVNLMTREVFLDGENIILLNKEFEILLLFSNNPNRVFSKEEIFEYVWKENMYESDVNTVMVHISNLRKKLHAINPNSPKIITYKGIGYKYIAECSENGSPH